MYALEYDIVIKVSIMDNSHNVDQKKTDTKIYSTYIKYQTGRPNL